MSTRTTTARGLSGNTATCCNVIITFYYYSLSYTSIRISAQRMLRFNLIKNNRTADRLQWFHLVYILTLWRGLWWVIIGSSSNPYYYQAIPRYFLKEYCKTIYWPFHDDFFFLLIIYLSVTVLIILYVKWWCNINNLKFKSTVVHVMIRNAHFIHKIIVLMIVR